MISLLLTFLARLGVGLAGWAAKRSDNALAALKLQAENDTERQRIAAGLAATRGEQQAAVLRTAMGHRMFWVAWSMAAIPMALWFGWGMLDTAFNGALPDVATIPPGLESWAKLVWDGLFYSGGAAAGAQAFASALAARKG